MTLSQSKLDALTALLAESLRVRAGEVLTADVIEERARNAAQLLSVAYLMLPIETTRTPHPDVECQKCGRTGGGGVVDTTYPGVGSSGHWDCAFCNADEKGSKP